MKIICPPAASLRQLALFTAACAIVAGGGAHARDALPQGRYSGQYEYPATSSSYPAQNPAPRSSQPRAPEPAAPAPREEQAKDRAGKKDWSYKLGAGVVYTPAYEGSDKYRTLPLPYIAVDYKDGLFFASMFDGIGTYPIRGDHYKLGVAAGFSFGRDESHDRKNLRGMGDIDMSPTASLLGEYEIGPVTLSGKLTQGSDEYGRVAEASIATMRPVSERLMLRAAIGTAWADDDHMQSYFGVSPIQSARSGYTRYEAESGFKSVGANVSTFYGLTHNIDLMVRLNADYLTADAADSPLTRKKFQPSLFTAVSYAF